MKNMRKLFAMVLAIVMVLSLATTAFAYDITLEGNATSPVAGHTYDVYQIFTGDLYNGVLSNIKYGSSYVPEGKKVGDLVPEDELTALTDANAFAKELVNGKKLGEAVATLNDANGFKATGLNAGYYLIVDNGPAGEGDAISAYIVKVVTDINMAPKSEAPTLDKEITGDDNTIEGDIAEDGESDNVSIGSKVEYTLTGTIPARAVDYDYYYYIINDTLSEGLTFNNDITVTIGGKTAVEDEDYYVYTGDAADGKTFQVALADARGHAGETVVVTYTATLNENAVIGEIEGNPNTADLTYSNNPNYDYNGDKEPGTPPDGPEQPGKPDKDDDVPTGNTPEDTTRTYTTGLKLVKVDENGNKLTGAEFKIVGENLVEILTVETVTYKEDAAGEYWKLKDGSYTTDEPHGDMYVVKTDNRDGGYVLDGDTYREATEDELADESVTLYTLIESNEEYYDSTTTKYSIDTITYSSKTEVENKTYTAYVNEDGYLILTGLGEGTYTITEIVAPDGYNLLTGSIVVEIEWTAPENEDGGDEDCEWSATVTYNGETKTLELNEGGIFELEIENRSGSTLPETGGMGTTMFYLFGGVMVLAAVVLLVTKKRMASAE